MSMHSGVMAAVAAVGVLGGAAMGSISQTIDLPDTFFGVHTTTFGNDPVVTYTFALPANLKSIIGIEISFDYDEVNADGAPALDSSWASDLGMTIAFGNGPIVGFGGDFRHLGALAGGYSLAEANAAVDIFDIWDFNGSASNAPGAYTHSFLFNGAIAKPETLVIQLTDTWNGNTLFTNFSITLVKIPAPGALALLGVAGLAGGRRRRSA